MKVSMKTFMPVAAAALLTLGACSNVRSRTEKYMKDRPQKELDMLLSGYEERFFKQQAKLQSRLDSTAFRDIFNGTAAAKDSALVEEFNKIAASYRADESATTDAEITESIKNKLINNDITVNDLKQVYKPGHVTTTQHNADRWAYKKFFEKIGVWHDVAQKCIDTSAAIGPW